MELTPEFIKSLSKEQLELLTELGDLADKETQLTEKIEAIRRTAEKAGIGREREVAKRLMDDPDFDRLLSVQLIFEREQVRDKIRSVMLRLVSAGLKDLGIIQRQAANYGVDLKN
jgi:hypothetical protein